MKYTEDHEPEIEDIDDYDKPLSADKRRIIIISFVAIFVVWGAFQLGYSLLVK